MVCSQTREAMPDLPGDVYDIRTKRRRMITWAEYNGMLDTLQKYFEEARRLWGKDVYRKSEILLHEWRWDARFNMKFREDTRDELRAILDMVYEEINDATI